eukprot:c28360_g1_i1 orf=29-256(-)
MNWKNTTKRKDATANILTNYELGRCHSPQNSIIRPPNTSTTHETHGKLPCNLQAAHPRAANRNQRQEKGHERKRG